jgi:putative transposase
VLDLRTRRVHVAGSTPIPDDAFMTQVARYLTDAVDGFLVGYRVLICDRGASSRRRRARRADADSGAECQCLRGAIRAFDPCRVPRSAHCPRERRLRHVVDQFVAHYHGERNYQGLRNELIAPQCHQNGGTHVFCRERLGGLLRYYHRAA